MILSAIYHDAKLKVAIRSSSISGSNNLFAVSDDLKQRVSKVQGTFTMIYKLYILIYNPDHSSWKDQSSFAVSNFNRIWKIKDTFWTALLIMLEGLIHSPAQAQHKHGAQDVEYQLDI